MKSTFFKKIIQELKTAGCEFMRRNNSHEIYRGLTGQTVTVPRKLDDRGVVHGIRKRAGISPER